MNSLLSLFSFLKTKQEEKKSFHHDLTEIYNCVKNTYFSENLNLQISWYGSGKTSSKTSLRLGYYNLRTQDIKINRILDKKDVPSFVIEYIVYHEILHHFFPPIQGISRRKIHHATFQLEEKKFMQYEEAVSFLSKFRKRIFYG